MTLFCLLKDFINYQANDYKINQKLIFKAIADIFDQSDQRNK